MELQTDNFIEGSGAGGAFKWLVHVVLLVRHQPRGFGEFPRALVARVGSLAGMPAPVDHPVVLADKSGRAVLALEGALVAMNLEMFLKAATPGEIIVAYRAHERPLATVEAEMLLKLVLPHERPGTLLALEGSAAVVRAHVAFQMARLGVRQLAQLTHVRPLPCMP